MTKIHARLVVKVAVVISVAIGFDSSRAMAAEGQDKPTSKSAAGKADAGKSVDDALLDDLDNELMDGLGDLKDRPGKKKSPAKSAEEETPLDQGLDGEDVGAPSDEQDPLGHIGRQMRRAERLIPAEGKRPDAETLQRQIVDDLARLIEQAEQQRSQQQSSKNSQQQQSAKRQSVQQPKSSTANKPGKNSTKPASDSTDRMGEAEAAKPDPELFKGLLKDSWGNLPDREREQMMQMSRERFLPQYELLIERYYRRLAEEHSK
jgi:hypothetical protein